MERIELEYKGKQERCVILNPTDLDSLKSIGTIAVNALRKNGPWADESQHETYAKTIEWFVNAVQDVRLEK